MFWQYLARVHPRRVGAHHVLSEVCQVAVEGGAVRPVHQVDLRVVQDVQFFAPCGYTLHHF